MARLFRLSAACQKLVRCQGGAGLWEMPIDVDYMIL